MELIERLNKLKEKFDRINQQLSDPSYLNDRDKIVTLSRERSELEEIIHAYEEYSSVLKDIDGNKEIIETSIDRDLTELADAELTELEANKERLEES